MILWAALGGTALPAQDVWVDDDCPSPGNGSPQEPYCSIQEAICQLRDAGGGTVRVLPGDYNESLRMFPGISVVSTDGPDVTTVDAAGRLCTTSRCEVLDPDITSRCAVVIWGSGSTNNDRLEGFRLTGGSGLRRNFGNGYESQTGGGIFVFNSSPTITNNVISENVLFSKTSHNFWGGGLYLGGGSYSNPTYPIITYNVIEDNSATPTLGDVTELVPGSEAIGGGIYVGLYTAPTIRNNIIRNNEAGDTFTESGVGGGIASYSISAARRPLITHNVIQGNVASYLGGGLFFGRIYDGSAESPTRGTVANNLIELNISDTGGGVVTNTSLVELRSNTIVDNMADVGGGLALLYSDPVEPTLANNVVAYNIAATGSGGGGAFYTTPAATTGNDWFGNSPDQIGGYYSDLDYIGIDGNFSLEPGFEDRTEGSRDLTPRPGSPLIDRGQPTVLSVLDLLGQPRVLDGDGDGVATVDVGAIEFAPDDDFDTIRNFADNCPADPNVDQADLDADGEGDACDPCPDDPENDDDLDADGICDGSDLCPSDADPDQEDFDGDAVGNACDIDDDNDTIADDEDPAPFDPSRCGDFDADGCDDCSNGPIDATNDGSDLDADGLCDIGDPDDDGDGIDDDVDLDPTDPFVCEDRDSDTCEDCSSGTADTRQDGPDFDADGICDAGDRDDDDDGVRDPQDASPHDPLICRDLDADGCDDCTRGTNDPADDGTDFDADGLCDAGDPDDDGDGVLDADDESPQNANACGDSDADTCDDCIGGSRDTANDGEDLDADGLCDDGDPDDDGDGVPDADDASPRDANACGDSDADTCDDCIGGSRDSVNDGEDLDADGLCDAGDPDDDGDGVLDTDDASPRDANACGDSDADTCDDCIGGSRDTANDGEDLDA
ncbi:right-handed parallel beta-helix repeat-containing protein, partial [bacterium]|nr:right-handed parallel beta-helix repeat-containing protein [bacterium]